MFTKGVALFIAGFVRLNRGDMLLGRSHVLVSKSGEPSHVLVSKSGEPLKWCVSMWEFLKIGVPENRWFPVEFL